MSKSVLLVAPVVLLVVLAGCAQLSEFGPGTDPPPTDDPVTATPVADDDWREENDPRPHVRGTPPSCTGNHRNYTASPLELDSLLAVEGQGNIAPPGHTLPTDHTYYTATGSTPLRAPGNITIWHVTEELSTTIDGTPRSNETVFSIEFYLCEDVWGYFDAGELSGGLATAVDNAEGESVDCQPTGPEGATECGYTLAYNASAREVLGQVRSVEGKETGIDFGTIDYRIEHDYVNPDRYRPGLLSARCTLELFVPSVREQLENKSLHPDDPCGAVNYDVAGTLSGNWFHEDVEGEITGHWDKELTFAENRNGPTEFVLAYGGMIADPGVIQFDPADNGTVNRRATDVTPDGRVYCFEDTHRESQEHARVRMVNETAIEIEVGEGECPDELALEEPAVYRR